MSGGFREIPVNALTLLEAAAELKALAKEITGHDKAYYQKDAPKISDAGYDVLRHRLDTIEAAFPDLVRAGSPSQKIGAAAAAGFVKVPHAIPMLSLGNAFNENDVAEFLARVRRFLGLGGDETVEIFCEPKIDGLSVSLRYVHGRFVLGATRGDGATGEDITENLKTIADIPATLENAPEVLEVRGEAYMAKSEFTKLNRAQEDAGHKVFANPRNAAAGSLRQKNSSVTASRPLNFLAYAWGQVIPRQADTHSGYIEKFKGWGFQVSSLGKLCRTMEEMLDFYTGLEELRPSLPFEIDGIVYKVNRIDWQDRLGQVSRAPRWAIAHKFAAEKVQTKILEINIQVGRTGSLTPVAKLEPIPVSGVMVSRATLHNEDYIIEKDIREKDTVIIQRAGDVIPQVLRVEKALRPAGTKPFRFPDKCHECGSLVIREEGEVARRCTGGLICPAQVLERLKHFVSRNAFNIEGLGGKRLEILVKKNLVKSPADLFRLRERQKDQQIQIGSLNRWAGKSVKKLFEEIERRSTVSFDRFIYALGIRHVGEVTAKNLAKKFTDISAFEQSVKEAAKERPGRAFIELSSIKGIGPVCRKNLLEYFEKNKNLQQKHLASGIEEQLQKLNIARLSKPAIRELAKHYKDRAAFHDAIYQATAHQPGEKFKELSEQEGVGVVALEAVIDFFGEERNADVVQDLKRLVKVYNDTNDLRSGPFSGMTIVFTGSLEGVSRNEAKAVAERLGGRISNSVSKNTNLVVAGLGGGSKLEAARKLGVKIIDEAEWMKLVQGRTLRKNV